MAIIDNLRSWLSHLGLIKQVVHHNLESAVEKAEIPPEYQKRFEIIPVVDPAQMLGRKKELEWILTAQANWELTHNPLIISGDPGEGMTSLLNAGSNKLNGLRILENNVSYNTASEMLRSFANFFGDPEAKSFDDLIDHVLQGETSTVVIENIERLFHRKVGGFRLMEDFLVFVQATRAHIFWIITINKYSKYFLNQAMSLDAYFPSSISLRPMTDEVLLKSIALRNEGFQCVFLAPDEKQMTSSMKRKLRNKVDVQERQAFLKDQFFKKMLLFAEGNITRAFLYWIKAIVEVHGQIIKLQSFEPPDLQTLSTEEILALENIHVHGSMSIEELQEISLYTSKKSQLIVAKLYEKNLLYLKRLNKDLEEYQLNLFYLQEFKGLFRDRLNRKVG